MGPEIITLPCSSPIPAGAVCICNCVAGSLAYPGAGTYVFATPSLLPRARLFLSEWYASATRSLWEHPRDRAAAGAALSATTGTRPRKSRISHRPPVNAQTEHDHRLNYVESTVEWIAVLFSKWFVGSYL